MGSVIVPVIRGVSHDPVKVQVVLVIISIG